MKKFLTAFLSVLFAVCLCLPLAACKDGDKPQAERKRIIGIDSEKTYLKAHYYLADNRDLHCKTLLFDVLSYDKIEESDVQGVDFDITTDSQSPLTVDEYEFYSDGYNESGNYYLYYVRIVMSMRWVTNDVKINTVTLKISGQDYNFKSDIHFTMHNYRPVFIEPEFYAYTKGDGIKGMYGVTINTRYDMTLKDVKFQTDGFEILSYYVEAYNATSDTMEKVTEELPLQLEANKQYRIFIEAIPPQDCLYYNFDIEAKLEISGIEMSYNNIEHSERIAFYGSALNALKGE